MPNKKNVSTEIRSLDTNGFYSDFSYNETYYAAIIRSPTSTGKVKSIYIEDLPENYYFYTAKDIPGLKSFIINEMEIKIFGYDNVSYTGEPLGIIIGPDETKVQNLLENVTINFDIESLESALKNVIKQYPRPFVSLSENRKNTKKGSSEEISNFLNEINELPPLNTVLDKNHIENYTQKILAEREIKTGIFKNQSVEEAEKLLFTENEDNFVSEEKWTEILTDLSWQETTGAFCYLENGKLNVYAPTKWTSLTMQVLADCLSLKKENIFINKTKVSGVYSKGLWRTTQIIAQVAVAAFLSKKPVKLILTQKEQDQFMIPGVKTEISYKSSIKKNGQINGMSIFIDVDTGVYNPFAQEIIDRLSISSCNYYKFENVHIVAKAHTSKNPPSSICLKSIDSQAFFAIENQMQKLSNQARVFPEDIRKVNTDKKSQYPIKINSDSAFDTLMNTLRMSDFNRKYASFHMDAMDRLQKSSNPFFAVPLRGIGIATAYNVSDFYGTNNFINDQKIEVTLISKDKVVIHAIKPSEVIQEIWKETASSILQINKENITIDSEYSIKDIPLYPEDTFSNIGTINELIKKCCNDIQKKRFHQPLPLTSKKGITSSAKKQWDNDDFSGSPYTNISFATCAVEVELDTYTYSEKIKGIWLTVDCGELFDEKAALRTLKLEIQQELSMLVEEKTVHCDKISIEFIKSKNKSGQVGALVHNTLPAAFSSALSLALETQLTKLPCTEKQIFSLIKERETATQPVFEQGNAGQNSVQQIENKTVLSNENLLNQPKTNEKLSNQNKNEVFLGDKK